MEPQLQSEPSALRNNVITIDRPDSAQLVDLHVYIIPTTVWQAQKNLAENDAIEQAISAGFVRVPQDLTIYDLRRRIQDTCGQEEGFPKEFIYLRSVGRCLAKVKPPQEVELRVKNYRPPITFSPEIYILEGHHDDDSSITGKSRSTLSRESHTQSSSTPSRRESWLESPRLVTTNNLSFPYSGGERQHSILLHGSASSSTSTFSRGSSTLSARDLAKLREEQERLRLRQLELARQRREIEEQQQKSGAVDSDRSLTSDNEEPKPPIKPQEQPTRDIKAEEQKHREEQEQRAAKAREEQKRQAEEEQRKREEDLRAQQKPPSKTEREKKEEEAALRIQSSYRGYQTRRQMREQKQHHSGVDVDDDKQRHDAHELERLQKEARELARRKAEEDHAAELEAHEVVRLSERLESIKVERKELETKREAIVRRMHQLHAQIAVRRTEERDLWKQKYLNEKKKTGELEEKTQTTTQGQPDLTTQIEQANLRLNNATKLRQQAESECQLLQQELQQIQQSMRSVEKYALPKQAPPPQSQPQGNVPIALDITLQY